VRVIDLGLAVLFCGLSACTDGKGMPFLPLPEAGSGGGYAGGYARLVAEAGRSAAAGRGAAGAAASGSDRKQTMECQDVGRMWSSSSAAADAALLQRINELRAAPFQLCGIPFRAQALIGDDQLRCIAQLRSMKSSAQRGGGPPSYTVRTVSRGGPDDPDEELRSRARLAGYVGDDLAELTIENVGDPSEAIAGIVNSPNAQKICGYLLFSGLAGIAHHGDTWFVDLTSLTQTSPAHSGPPMPGEH
jgi:hypothetical protein